MARNEAGDMGMHQVSLILKGQLMVLDIIPRTLESHGRLLSQ